MKTLSRCLAWLLCVGSLTYPSWGLAEEHAITTVHQVEAASLDEAPFFERKEGLQIGCDTVFYRRLAQQAGIHIHISAYPVARLLNNVSHQQADLVLVPGASPNAHPDYPGYDYVGPVFVMQELLVTREPPLSDQLNAFNGLRMGLASGSCWQLCRQMQTIAHSKRTFRSVEQALSLLQNQRVDVVLVPEMLYLAALHQLRLSDERFVTSHKMPGAYLFLAIAKHLPQPVRQRLKQATQTLGPDLFRRECEREIERHWPRKRSSTN